METDIDSAILEIGETIKRMEARGGLRGGSRYVEQGADPDVVQTIARGGSVGDVRTVPNHSTGRRSGGGLALGLKALAESTPSAGGYAVAPELSAEILTMLRARSAISQLGVTTVQVKKELDLTRLSAGATAYWVSENAAIPTSEQSFSQGPLLRPRELAALVPASNKLLRDAVANPDIEAVLRSDLAEVMALREDLAYIEGLGTDEEPLGIRHITGTTPGPSLGNNGRTPTFDDLKAMVAALRAKNATFRRPGWLFNPRLLSTLEVVKDSTGRYLADSGLLTFNPMGTGGTLLGYPFQTSTQVPTGITTGSSNDTSYIVFGSDWQEAFIGENLGLTIELSSEASYWDGAAWVSSFQNRQTLFRALRNVDFALRRPELFTLMSGVRA